MNTFESQWNSRKQALSNSRCPLDEQTLRNTVRFATTHRPALPVPATTTLRPHLHPLRYAAAAIAAVALISIPLTIAAHNNSPRTVDYNGQPVRFICNNQCTPGSVISNFNDYLDQI